MNHTYRLVWNEASQSYVPAAEGTRARKKSGGCKALKRMSVIAAASIGSVCVGSAYAGPTGGEVVAGQASIDQTGTATTIHQQSQNVSLNWQQFNVAANETVQFVQPSATSIALNRVIGNEASEIFGQLSANGRVFLVNPNGLLFGQSAQVNVGGLVASTLNISNDDFLGGRYQFTSRAAIPASVVNQGTITAASGGSVALLGGQVSNQGTISAQLGTVALAAGSAVSLDFTGQQLMSIRVDAAALGALASNQQLIQADGGTVLMTAAARDALLSAVVNNTGVIEARTAQNQNGVIKLIGSFDGGTVNVGGTLDASAPNGGSGGFVETSGAHVKVASGARITTAAPRGTAGTWLIDPSDYTIAAAGGDIDGATLSGNLQNGNITIATTQDGNPGNGDIHVNDDVTWSNANTLTLTAIGNVNVSSAITNTGSPARGGVTLRADSEGACVAGAAASACGTVNFFGSGHITAADVNLYYNPAGSNFVADANGIGPHYATSTDYSANVTGTLNAYMLVNDVNQLQAILTNLNGSYALGRNIDASATRGWNNGEGFEPLGRYDRIDAPFTGHFDGQGHTISGLFINRPSRTFVGLFGGDDADSTIRNVGLIGAEVTGRSSALSAGSSGLLVGIHFGTLSNAYATGAVTGSVSVGGLVGENYGTLSNAHYGISQVSINGANYLTAGALYDGQYQDWIDHGLSLDIDDYASLAYDSGSGSYLIDDVQGMRDLVGFAQESGYAFALSADIDLSSAPGLYIPEFMGSRFDGNGHSITNLSIDAPLSTYVGMFGQVGPSSTVANLSVAGTIRGGSGVGGLIGRNQGTIENVRAAGSVSGSVSVGGLVGENEGTVRSAYAEADVSGTNVVGGLVGGNYQTALVRNAYATGSVTGDIFIGGLVGFNAGTVSTTYATGAVSGTDAETTGGLIGTNQEITTPPVVEASYWNTQTSGQSSSAAGTGLSGSEMQQLASFSNWNISGSGGSSAIWRIYEGYTTPLLRSFMTNLTIAVDDASTTYNGTDQSISVGYDAGAADRSLIFAASSDSHRNVGHYGDLGQYLYSSQLGYDISYTDGAWDIVRANLTLSTSDIVKTYDGTTTANGTVVVTGGTLFAGDSLSGGTFAFTNRNAGTNNRTVTSSGVTIDDGNGGGNYNVTFADNTTSTINTAVLTVSGTRAADKVYDGTVDATIGGGVLSGLIAGDTVDLLQSGAFNDKNAGAGKTATLNFALQGTDAGNYVLASSTGTTTASIAPKALSYMTTAAARIYDGTTAASVMLNSLTGLVGAETVVVTGTGTFNSKDVATANSVTVNSVTLANGSNGGLASNYTIAAGGTAAAFIIPANLTITANEQTRVAGTPNPALTLTYSGFVAGESVASLTTPATASTIADITSPAGRYAITASGASSSNYVFTYVPGTLTVLNAELSGYPGTLAYVDNLGSDDSPHAWNGIDTSEQEQHLQGSSLLQIRDSGIKLPPGEQ